MKSIRIEPYHLELEEVDGQGFTFTFHDASKKVKVRLARWWIPYLVNNMKDYVQRQDREIALLKKDLGMTP